MTIRPLPIRGGPKGRLRGVALLIVMLLTFAMAVIVTAFAYTMKVEGRLATRTQSESETEWMGRSGIELAKWVQIGRAHV